MGACTIQVFPDTVVLDGKFFMQYAASALIRVNADIRARFG